MINGDVNANNRLKKVYVTMALFGILVTVNVNGINYIMLENI